MIKRGIPIALCRFSFIISLCLIVLLNIIASTCADLSVWEISNIPHDAYSHEKPAVQHSNRLIKLIKNKYKFTLFKVLASIVSLTAVSLIISKCLRFMKTGQKTRLNSLIFPFSRRLAADDDNENPCMPYVANLLDQSIKLVKNRAISISGASPEDPKAQSDFEERIKESIETQHRMCKATFWKHRAKALSDKKLTADEMKMLNERRDELYETKILPNLWGPKEAVVFAVIDAFYNPAIFTTARSIDLSELITLLTAMKKGEEIEFGSKDYFQNLRDTFRDKSVLLLKGDRQLLENGPTMLTHLWNIYDTVALGIRTSREALEEITLEDAELLKRITPPQDKVNAGESVKNVVD